tara:strand:- start:55 stop:672 length:618 start_codon:yes stop_codon:yes gene_type:complete
MDTNNLGNEFSQIIDNFLPEEQFNNLYDFMMTPGKMSWKYNDVVDYEGSTGDRFQLTHTFFDSPQGIVSPISEIIQPFIDLLKIKVIIRIKANLNVKCGEKGRETKFHYDHEFVGSKLPDGTLTSFTAIYYVNTNNGYTLFKDGNFKVDSVANRLVIFDSSKLHKGVRCTDEKIRVVINFNYFTFNYGSTDQTAASIKRFNEANA